MCDEEGDEVYCVDPHWLRVHRPASLAVRQKILDEVDDDGDGTTGDDGDDDDDDDGDGDGAMESGTTGYDDDDDDDGR